MYYTALIKRQAAGHNLSTHFADKTGATHEMSYMYCVNRN